MQKPSGYDEAKASGEFIPVELGGHYATIKQVTERQSSTGKDMIVVLFDFTTQDKQPGYFTAAYNNSDRDGNEKKWPFNGSKYIMVYDYNDVSRTSRAFKTFCTSFEKSNNCKVQWGGNNWAQQFKGKRIGVIYGEEENEYEGRITMRHVPKWFCSWDSVETASIPRPKYINGTAPAVQTAATTNDGGMDGFLTLPEGMDDEEIPF